MHGNCFVFFSLSPSLPGRGNEELGVGICKKSFAKLKKKANNLSRLED